MKKAPKKFAELTPAQKAVLASPAGFAKGFLGLTPYPRHCEVMNAVAKDGSQVTFRAANEVGKTSNVAAPLILWHLTVFPRGKVVSTAGAWRQVKDQLVPYLKRHQTKFPKWTFNDTNIVVDGVPRYSGFSTNDAGKFEGYHGTPEEPLLIIIDEAKTVKNDIYAAVERCKPQRLLQMSSPGDPSGMFYDSFHSLGKFYQQFKMDAFDAPHITKESVEKAIQKYGKEHPLVKSMIFGEFMDIVEGALLSLAEYDACQESPPRFKDGEIKAHCDFAAGGDENVLALRVGNRVRIVDAWRDKNTMSAVGKFVSHFNRLRKEVGLTAEMIDGDADGLGKPMVDAIREAGWDIGEFHGGQEARFDTDYFNLITECWFSGADAIKKREVILEHDEDLKAQLISRKSRWHSKGKLWLESKEDLKKRGLPSPDRADAVLGALMPSMRRNSVPMGGSGFDPASQGWLEHPAFAPDAGVLAGLEAGL